MSTKGALVGTVVDGKYEVERLLGRGGMGEVYAARHLQLERPVALKILHGDLNSDETFLARFTREARAAAKLQHANAVSVYDFGSLEDGSAYIVMEFIEGETLRHLLRREGPLAPVRALDLLRQAAGAVAAAHARGIVHRDIKPDNIMVRTDETGRDALKVVDFGLAKMIESATQITAQADMIGTPKYMAPEQVSGEKIDERADVYALGCVLFEMLAGRAPFEGTSVEVAYKHVLQKVPTFESLGISAPDGVEEAVLHALAKDPADRTPSAVELVRELEEACGVGSTLPGRPVPRPVQTTFGERPSLPGTMPQRAATAGGVRAELTGGLDEETRPRRTARASRDTAIDSEGPATMTVVAPRQLPGWLVPAATAGGFVLLLVLAVLYWNATTTAPPLVPATNAPVAGAQPSAPSSTPSSVPIATEPEPAPAPTPVTPTPVTVETPTVPATNTAPAPQPTNAAPAPQPAPQQQPPDASYPEPPPDRRYPPPPYDPNRKPPPPPPHRKPPPP